MSLPESKPQRRQLDPEDARILRCYAQGEYEEGGRQFAERHGAWVQRAVERRMRRYAHNPGLYEEHEDVAQRVLMRGEADLRDPVKRQAIYHLRGWLLYKVNRAPKDALSAWKRRQRVGRLHGDPADHEENPAPADAPFTPEDDLDARRGANQLRDCLSALPERHQRVLIGWVREDWTLARIALELDTTFKRARTLKEDLLMAVRRCLHKKGWTLGQRSLEVP